MLFEAHNEMKFYTWSEQRCCLPKGATSAELDGHFPDLQKGDVLIFEEVLGPRTGQPGDADPAHRHAVRLTQQPVLDVDPLNGNEFTQIEWGDEDALTFPLCISSRTDEEHGEKYLGNTVSVARGNIVLCDHGLTETNAPIPDTVPASTIFRPTTSCDPCAQTEPVAVPPRYRPVLKDQPLTFAAPFDRERVGGVGDELGHSRPRRRQISLLDVRLDAVRATVVAETRLAQQRSERA